MAETDTIFALSSGRPPAAIAVVRISGPRARLALETMIGKVPEPRRAALARVRAADGVSIDSALVLVFLGPHGTGGRARLAPRRGSGASGPSGGRPPPRSAARVPAGQRPPGRSPAAPSPMASSTSPRSKAWPT